MSERGNQILVVDFGSQYTQLIARRIREVGVYCEIVPFDAEDMVFSSSEFCGFVLSGGPESVTEDVTPRIPQSIFDSRKPILGICYGMQAMAQQLGGTVSSSTRREFGYARVNQTQKNPLLDGLDRSLDVWMSHGDNVIDVPPGFESTASTATSPIAVMMHAEKRYFGLQFHPEVSHTQRGTAILDRFVTDVCGCSKTWTARHIIKHAVDEIRERVGGDRVILGLSGGVDSSVAASLISQAIGDQLTCVFVDNGLLRKNERERVQEVFEANNEAGMNLITIDARDRFLSELQGVEDPERKRKIIGGVFIDAFEDAAKELKSVRWLAQGTIYPDVVESAASRFGKSHVIKSHHNVGGLPDRLNLKLLEPLRELFKDEVRELGYELGLPSDIVDRHPFPGPGLAVRVLGEVTEERLSILREADAIFLDELKENHWYEKVEQAFAVYLPVNSVGVVGDTRRYEHVIALRAVNTTDFMTADWVDFPAEMLGKIANRITNEVPGVSRVVYDVSSKPPATIEWE